MSVFKNILFALFLILLFLAGILFALRNDQTISIDFILFQTPSWSLGLWLLAALVAGAGLGWIATGYSVMRLRFKNYRLARERESQRRELQTRLQEKR